MLNTTIIILPWKNKSISSITHRFQRFTQFFWKPPNKSVKSVKSMGLFMPIRIGLCSRLYSCNVPALGGYRYDRKVEFRENQWVIRGAIIFRELCVIRWIRNMKNKKRCVIKLWHILLIISRCLAESNRSTRFCRPLPNRSVKTPCRLRYCMSHLRLQRYYFYLVPPNFFPTFSCFFSHFS